MAADFVHPDACDEYRHVFCGCDGRNVVHAVFCSLCDRSRSSLLQTASAGDQRADYLCDRIRSGSEASDPGTGAALCRYGFAGKLLWVNKEFTKITGKDTQYHKCIATIFPELTVERLPKNEEETDINVAYGEKNFRAHVKSVCIDELIQNSEMINTDIKGYFIQALYLFDETELREYMRKFEDETMVTGLLYLDNYDEALESVEEVRRSLLTALVERKINKYFNDLDGLVKRYENDKYIVVMRRSSLNELKEKKFDILEDVKTINIGNEMAVTISMGIGADAGSFAKNSEYAKIAIDLALGRGGDQVVLKDGSKIQYFGGKTQAVEKNTRVKARVKAHALKEFMNTKEKRRCHGTPPAGCRFVRCGHRYLPCGENAE